MPWRVLGGLLGGYLARELRLGDTQGFIGAVLVAFVGAVIIRFVLAAFVGAVIIRFVLAAVERPRV